MIIIINTGLSMQIVLQFTSLFVIILVTYLAGNAHSQKNAYFHIKK